MIAAVTAFVRIVQANEAKDDVDFALSLAHAFNENDLEKIQADVPRIDRFLRTNGLLKPKKRVVGIRHKGTVIINRSDLKLKEQGMVIDDQGLPTLFQAVIDRLNSRFLMNGFLAGLDKKGETFLIDFNLRDKLISELNRAGFEVQDRGFMEFIRRKYDLGLKLEENRSGLLEAR